MKRLRTSGRMAVLTVVIVGAIGGGASAYFTATGAGTATALVGTVSPPSNISAMATGDSGTVTIAWDASAGISPERYDLLRTRNASDAAPVPVLPPACKTSAKPLTPRTTCKDLGLPDGTYTYTVVAKYHSFSASADSNPVTVDRAVKPGAKQASPVDGSATTLAQGTDTAQATQTDTAGDVDTSTANTSTANTSAANTSAASTFFVDPSAPAVTPTSPADASPMATTTNTFVLDTTAPKLSTLHMLDRNANGKVDEVKATFDETLAASSATEPWTLTNVPSGGTLSAVSTSGNSATLTIDEGSHAADTAVGSFKVALAASAGAIRDTTGNEASFVATTPSDLAGPVLMTARSDGTTTPNLMQTADTLVLTFSEALAPSSVPASPDVTESSFSSTGTLKIPGLIAPTTIDSTYLAKSGDSATSSTTSELTGETVTVTLGTLTTDGSAAAGSDGASIFPAASLKDPAGNAAASAAPATARLASPLF